MKNTFRYFVFRYVFWYHNKRMINYDSERGISVTTTPGRRTHSQLSIKKADVSDSGNYTCAPSSALPASIHVFVSGNWDNININLFNLIIFTIIDIYSTQNSFYYFKGSEVKPWTSGANGIKFCADLIYLVAPLMCANLVGFKNSLKTVSLYFLWSTMFTNSWTRQCS